MSFAANYRQTSESLSRVKAVEQHFGQIKSTYDNTEVPILTRCRYTGSDIRIRDDAMPLAHIALAVEAPGYDSADHLALTLASSVSTLHSGID